MIWNIPHRQPVILMHLCQVVLCPLSWLKKEFVPIQNNVLISIENIVHTQVLSKCLFFFNWCCVFILDGMLLRLVSVHYRIAFSVKDACSAKKSFLRTLYFHAAYILKQECVCVALTCCVCRKLTRFWSKASVSSHRDANVQRKCFQLLSQ